MLEAAESKQNGKYYTLLAGSLHRQGGLWAGEGKGTGMAAALKQRRMGSKCPQE